MSKLKALFTNVRVWVLIVFLILSLVAINPKIGVEGVAIRHVVQDSQATLAGMQVVESDISPTNRERITEVNYEPVQSVEHYYQLVDSHPPNTTVRITTSEDVTYNVFKQPIFITDGETNETVMNGSLPLGITVFEAPKSNIRLGLDLSGGTRVILTPEKKVSESDLNLVIDHIDQRLNIYGLSDVKVKSATDLSGDDFIIVEIAGANKEEVQELLSQQGKFEARIANETVFSGGDDITYVCRTAECSGIDRQQGCGQEASGAWFCRFSFQIQLSQEAADRQAAATNDLEIIYNQSTEGYLSHPLDLVLDDEFVDSLNIAGDLKGRAATDIVISGSGSGPTRAAAEDDAIENMKTLQTVLITGSLPVKLEIVKSDGISAVLGKEFVKNAFLLAALSILAVAIVVAVRYKKPIISVPVVVTMMSEIIIILGFAAAARWNLDLAAIAAIIIAIGSGVDDQIVLIDETLHAGTAGSRSWKERLSAAFFIIIASFLTLVAAMFPLLFAGAGLLKGFALTTIVGVSAGVLITRPAFAKFIEILLKKEE